MIKCPDLYELSEYIKYKNNKEIEEHLINCDKCLDIVILQSKNKDIKLKKIDFKKITSIVASLFLFIIISLNFNKTELVNESEVYYYSEYFEEFNNSYDKLINDDIIEYFNDNDDLIFELS